MAEKYPYCDMNVSFFVIFRRRWRIYLKAIWKIYPWKMLTEYYRHTWKIQLEIDRDRKERKST